MVDLTTETIKSSFEKQGKGFAHLVDAMESCESWTLDNDSKFKRAIINWASSLEKSALDSASDADIADLIKIMSLMSCSRSLALLTGLEDVQPGLAAKLLISANFVIASNQSRDMRSAIVFRDRLVTLYQANFLQRIFSPERIEGIKNAITEK